MSGVRISLHNGEVHHTTGWADAVMNEIASAQLHGRFAKLERDTIPTGQFFYIDPTQVSSIKNER